MKIILIGIQGAGKSTQGNILSEKLGIPYLSTGHIFREMAKEKTKLGRYIKEIMNAGYLIPDDKTVEIVKQYLEKPEYANGYIIDGFQRTVAQAQAFQNGAKKAIYLKVTDEEALRRISFRNGNGRSDETPRAIAKRIESFHIHTEPVIDYYRKNKNILPIFDKGEVAKVSELEAVEDKILAEDILQRIAELADEERGILILRYFEDFELKEIAVIINKNYSATKVLVFRSLKKLKNLLTHGSNKR